MKVLSLLEKMFADVLHSLHRKKVTATFMVSGVTGGRSPRLTRMKTGLINDCVLESNKEVIEALHYA